MSNVLESSDNLMHVSVRFLCNCYCFLNDQIIRSETDDGNIFSRKCGKLVFGVVYFYQISENETHAR